MAAVVIRYAGIRRILPLDAPTLLSALLEQAEVPLAKPCGVRIPAENARSAHTAHSPRSPKKNAGC